MAWEIKANFPCHDKRLIMSAKTHEIILNYINVAYLDGFELRGKILQDNNEYPIDFYLRSVSISRHIKIIILKYSKKSV